MSKQNEYEHLSFFQSVTRLDRELHSDYIGGFYAWADAIFDGAWSAAANKLERALRLVENRQISRQDFQIEQSLYFERVSELIKEYRKFKKLDETDAFLKSLATGETNGNQ